MITGAYPLTAASIAVQLGICQAGDAALVGHAIEAMDDEELLSACRRRHG